MAKKIEAGDYITSDLGCAAALVSAGFDLLGLNKQDPQKVRFIFRSKKGIEETANEYFVDRLEVKARKFFDNIRMLKNLLHG